MTSRQDSAPAAFRRLSPASVCVARALVVCSAGVGCPLALAAAPLYSNGSANPAVPALATGAMTASGVAAPPGSTWSETAGPSASESNAIGGFSSHLAGSTGAYRFADDFTVPAPHGWLVESISLFAYQTNASPGASPFSGVNMRIWNGRPGDPGSAVIFGDASTNRISLSTSTAVYRVFNTIAAPVATPNASRLIWQTDASALSGGNPLFLAPGTYWVDWQYTAAMGGGDAFSPPVTIAGLRTAPGCNARQFKTTGGGQWTDVLDPGKPAAAPDAPQDLPFIVRGEPFNPCPADLDGDGQVGSTDLAFFLGSWGATGGPADINGDGLVNSSDLALILGSWGPCE